jgi:2-phospho-L-lactate/phosphoenolpyruvate guanylyltransferase
VSVWALVPVKSLHATKQRLCQALDARQRRQLSEFMLREILTTLATVRGLAGVAVVTPEPIDLVTGPRHITDPGGGLNAALDSGIRVLAGDGAQSVVVLPADIPFAAPQEVESLLSVGREAEVVIVPDRSGSGTNALFLSPPTAIQPIFGPDSFRRHVHRAQAGGLRTRSLSLPGIGFDIDTPGDLNRLRRRVAGSPAFGFLDTLVTAAE